MRLLRITSQVLGVIYGCDVLNKFKLIRVALARVLLARLLGGSLKIGFIGGTPGKG